MKKLIIILLIILITYCFYSLHTHRTPQEGEQTTFTPLPIEVYRVKAVTEPHKVLLAHTPYTHVPLCKVLRQD